ncbi:cysteine/serine endopeptidase inhibitor [Kitasatospora sp. NPDC048540]|uniref:cysteine/serine endopeptidase inhibitor n=1 Tax=unclassified Kitasatospora TaxID=2633591 RepID=UPI000691A6D1|nr:cysteine/serine endopeptidase inhibitor [Kitasatospora sp. MBT63]
MRVVKNLKVLAGVPLAAAALTVLGAGTAAAAIPVNKPMTGSMTYYTDAGFGACGTQINASTQLLVAVPHTWWTSANPNNDPLCGGIAVKVTYQGRSITVPVRDKCPSCDATHIDLSEPAFARLAPLDLGVVNGITWQFVRTTALGATTPLTAPTPVG